jgi:hypothetical protein
MRDGERHLGQQSLVAMLPQLAQQRAARLDRQSH